MSAAEAGGEAARICLEIVRVSSVTYKRVPHVCQVFGTVNQFHRYHITSGRFAALLLACFISLSASIPPREVSRTFQRRRRTFFIGK